MYMYELMYSLLTAVLPLQPSSLVPFPRMAPPARSDGGPPSVRDRVVSVLLRAFLITFYVVSHLYDYVTFPLFFLWSRAWRVRRYKRNIHARREDRDDAVLFHSLVEPGPVNVMVERNGLKTMDKLFRFVSAGRRKENVDTSL